MRASFHSPGLFNQEIDKVFEFRTHGFVPQARDIALEPGLLAQHSHDVRREDRVDVGPFKVGFRALSPIGGLEILKTTGAEHRKGLFRIRVRRKLSERG